MHNENNEPSNNYKDDDNRTENNPQQREMVARPTKDSRVDQILERTVAFERGENQERKRTDKEYNSPEESERRKHLALTQIEIEARNNGCWIEDLKPYVCLEHDPFPKGQECEVYRSADLLSVIKLNNLSIMRDVTSFLERIKLYNDYFPALQLNIIGFALNSEAQTCFVIEQPFVENIVEATYQGIGEYFIGTGWHQLNVSEFTNGSVEIWDAYPKNVLTNEEGEIFVVDVNFDIAREQFKKYKNE